MLAVIGGLTLLDSGHCFGSDWPVIVASRDHVLQVMQNKKAAREAV